MVFAVTGFLSAFLIFFAEFAIAKSLLPIFGGSATVWVSCTLIFQLFLLAGYGLANRLTHLRPRLQIPIYLSFWAIAIAVISPAWSLPATSRNFPGPEALQIGLLTFQRVGPAFIVLSTVAPMIQALHYRQTRQNPYWLYAVSNTGSLLGAGYPFILEPFLSLEQQGVIWTWGCRLAFCLMVVGVGWSPRKPDPSMGSASPAVTPDPVPSPLSGRRQWQWILLAAVPSSLQVGLSTYLTHDVAAIPFLWTVPLSLYLISFILAFAGVGAGLTTHPATLWGLSLLALPLFVTGNASGVILIPTFVAFGVHTVAVFLICWVLHSELAALKPEAQHLTRYYLFIALGGLIGTGFNVVAPQLYRLPLEYPIVILIATTVAGNKTFTWRAGTRKPAAFYWVLGVTILAGLGWFALCSAGVVTLISQWSVTFVAKPLGAIFALAITGAAVWVFRVNMLLTTALLMVMGLSIAGVYTPLNYENHQVIFSDRSFYNSLRVLETEGLHTLVSGNTVHGLQLRDQPQTITTYYRPAQSAIAACRQFLGKPQLKVGAVGLGTGTLAAAAMPGEDWTFYEIDPLVIRIASDPRFFSFLSAAKTKINLVEADGRLGVAGSEGNFDVIVLDAFISDSIPTHLLTREALNIYLSKIRAGGVLLVHVSNRFFNLKDVVIAAAQSLGYSAAMIDDVPAPSADDAQILRFSEWVLVSKDANAYTKILFSWQFVQNSTRTFWRDTYTNLIDTLKIRKKP